MPRRYVMCPPTHFALEYAINPWMTAGAAVDSSRATAQWERLVSAYERLGHSVSRADPVASLPDLVFAANSALVIGDRVFLSRFRYPEREPEADLYLAHLRGMGAFEVRRSTFTCEGEGDLTPVGETILAGFGFRTDIRAHAEVAEFFGREVLSLELVDPRYYHLDTALFALDAANVAYFPDAFSPAAQSVLEERFPNALIAAADDAAVLGLNAMSDGRTVVINREAERLAAAVAERGYRVVPVDLGELRKSGGGPKCCTLELHDVSEEAAS